MIDSYDIRPARPEDLADATALLAESRLPLAGFAEHLGDALVATRGGRVVGVVELELYGRDALLRSLVVSPTERGARLGERLAAGALRMAGDRGVGDVYLLTETAEGFFPRFGFAKSNRAGAPAAVRESVEFRLACPESAVMMHARIGRS
jgi:amino-acid N-acetyltransferase